MAASSKDALFRCYQCGVDFQQERALLRHFSSKRHRELEDIREKAEQLQQQESSTLTEVPVLPEVISTEATNESCSVSGESDVGEPDMDMDVSGSEQGVAQNESSAEEETVFDMEHESLLMTEG